MKIPIQPLQAQVTAWTEKYVPERDLFFLRESDLKIVQDKLEGTLLIPRAELSNHTSYNKIQWVNSYETWNISRDAQYVIVAQPTWITSLSLTTKESIVSYPTSCGEGVDFPHIILF